MLYYYQIRNHHFKTEAVPQFSCPLCGNPQYLHMSIMQKYTWMVGPISPSAKYAIAWCEYCEEYIPRVKWTDEMDSIYTQVKKGLKTPARLYRGLWVLPLTITLFIAILVGIIRFTNSRQQQNQDFVKQATAHPQTGDIFQVNHSMGSNTGYTYFKVAGTTADSIYVQEAGIRRNDMKQWDEVPTDEAAYEPKQMSFSLAKLSQMDMFIWGNNDSEYGLIFGVWRNGKLYKKY